MPSPTPGAFPCHAMEGGWSTWVFSRASQGHAHHGSPSSASPYLGKLLDCQRSLGCLLLPRAAFLGQFFKDEASGTFSMVRNPAGNKPAPSGSLGDWKDPCGGSSTLRIPAAATGLVLDVVVQLSSAPWAPLDSPLPPQAGSSKSTIGN